MGRSERSLWLFSGLAVFYCLSGSGEGGDHVFGVGSGPAVSPPRPAVSEKERYRRTIINPDRVPLSATEREIIHLTNLWRIRNGLKPLTIKRAILGQARRKSRNMAAVNKLSHNISPRLTVGAENIAMGHRNAREVFIGWKNSPGHNANMLNKDLKTIGVGVATSEGGSPYYTQVFGF